MDYLARLKAAYRTHAGIGVVSGLSAQHFPDMPYPAFTRYLGEGRSLTNDLGISLWELMMLERVCRALAPRCIFIIGNGMGWSALALSMMNPDAFVVTVEPETGIELTNRIAVLEQLKCVVVKGASPGDNARVIRDFCPMPPDLVLIDGMHFSQQIVADFDATFELAGRSAAYFFHDVVNFNMFPGLFEIRNRALAHGMRTQLLLATPSGMAVVAADDAPQAVWDAIDVFSLDAGELGAIGESSGSAVPAEWLDYAAPVRAGPAA